MLRSACAHRARHVMHNTQVSDVGTNSTPPSSRYTENLTGHNDSIIPRLLFIITDCH